MIVAFVASLLLVWGIGLTPALCIRYALLRRPLNRGTATWVAAGSSACLWAAFRVLDSALGPPITKTVTWLALGLNAAQLATISYRPQSEGPN